MRDRHGRGGSAQDGIGEDEAELKVRTALQRMGEDGISRAWEEFEAMDPGGRRGWVREEELVEVRAGYVHSTSRSHRRVSGTPCCSRLREKSMLWKRYAHRTIVYYFGLFDHGSPAVRTGRHVQ